MSTANNANTNTSNTPSFWQGVYYVVWGSLASKIIVGLLIVLVVGIFGVALGANYLRPTPTTTEVLKAAADAAKKEAEETAKKAEETAKKAFEKLQAEYKEMEEKVKRAMRSAVDMTATPNGGKPHPATGDNSAFE